jgi:lysophospholipase L1-like esterase
MKIVLLGDSILARFGRESIELLESLVPGADVYNCAVGGWNSDDVLRKSNVIAELKPAIVVISLGMNDAAPWKMLALPKFQSNLTGIFAAFGTARKVFVLPPPIDEQKANMPNDRTNAGIKQYCEVARDACVRANVEVLDTWHHFEPLLGAQEVHTQDGIHFNDAGQELFTRFLAEILGKPLVL